MPHPPHESTDISRFFAPDKLGTSRVEREYNDTLNNDGALDAYAETILWRVGGVHAMIRYEFSLSRGREDAKG